MIKIYSLHHPKTGELRYIGKTKEFYLSSRLCGHIRDANNPLKNYKASNWIKSILNENLKPEIFLLDEVEENEWEFWEIFYISYFKGLGCRLVNTTIGGDSGYTIKGRKLTEEHKQKIAISSRKPRINKENFGIRRKVPILQFTLDNIFMKEHVSALDAYRETGIWKESIRNCCNNRSKMAGNYIWKYKNKRKNEKE